MTTRTLLLIGLLATSLAANGALLRKLTGREAATSLTAVGASSGTERTAEEKTDPTLPTWDAINANALEDFPAKLSATGMPKSLVSDLARARLAVHFDARRRETLAQQPSAYWSPRYFTEAPGGGAMRALSREYRDALRSMLGPEATISNQSPQAIADMQRTYGPISPVKLAALQEITGDYAELRQAIQSEAGMMTLSEDREKLDLLAREEQADLQALFTPEEYLEYQLRRSPAANQVRNQLQGVEVTEAEFRELYQLQQAFQDEHGTRTTPANINARQTAERQLYAEMKALLGEERGTEYENNRDFAYREVKSLASRLNLPAGTATDVYALQRDLQQRANSIRANRNLTADQRTAQMSALSAEASSAITGKLGATGFSVYQQTSAGRWLQSLTASPAGAPTSAVTAPTIILR